MSENFEKEIDEVNYSYRGLIRKKPVIYIIIFSLIYILSQLSLKSQIDGMITKAIRSSGCPISYTNYNFEFFLPKVIVNDLKVPASCTGLSKPLAFKELRLNFRGPSFSPIGLAFSVETKLINSPINAKVVAGFSSITVHLENSGASKENIINLADLNSLQRYFKLSGHLHLSNVLLSMSMAGNIEDLKLNIASKDFKIPAQTIQIFKVGNIDIGNFLLQAELENKKNLNLKQLTLGKDGSDIVANFKGKVVLNQNNIRMSKTNIRGELSLSAPFQEKYAWTNFVFSKFDKKDNFYQIEMTGTLGAPNFSSAR